MYNSQTVFKQGTDFGSVSNNWGINLAALAVMNYEKHMEWCLEKVFVYEKFVLIEKDTFSAVLKEYDRFLVGFGEPEHKYTAKVKEKIAVLGKDFKRKFLSNQTIEISEKLLKVLAKYNLTMLKNSDKKSYIQLEKVHDQSAKIAEEELQSLPYLKENSMLWLDTEKQLTSKITELKNLYFQHRKKQLHAKKKDISARLRSYIDANDIKVNMTKSGVLGSGGFGIVRVGFIKYYGIVAIKVPRFNGSRVYMESREKKFIKEVELLHHANHENILRMLGYTTLKDSMAIITEYMPCENLATLLFQSDGNNFLVPVISRALGLRFCSDICRGVSYLHFAYSDQRVVHGDLKPENIFLTSDLNCKVGDFGGADIATCTEFLSSTRKRSASSDRTRGYIAPERLSNPDLRVSKAMDVYSVGMIFSGVLRRQRPTENVGLNRDQIIQYCLQSTSKQGPIVSTLRNMMLKCTNHDAQQRPKITEVRDELNTLLCTQNPVEIAQGVTDVLKTYNCKHFIDYSTDFVPLADVDSFYE